MPSRSLRAARGENTFIDDRFIHASLPFLASPGFRHNASFHLLLFKPLDYRLDIWAR
jgi:hypothetical protein